VLIVLICAITLYVIISLAFQLSILAGILVTAPLIFGAFGILVLVLEDRQSR
jgi:hypothetical protein